ncbi:MAG: PDZ domain-containing protein [Planctomycetaceae bacterium]|nr:PDZ domain-containing protein [Planctomycetaceae bacterium]
MLLAFVLILSLTSEVSAQKKSREEKVREDKARVTEEGFWIYNDLPAAFQQAKQTGKPILVVLRCLPCEECVKLDDELVDQDPVIRPLLEKFVCVRQVSTNGLDLSVFQYDTDQSFAVFMLNADKTIYGRFGTRSHRTEWFGDVSLPGLAEALKGALALHADYPANKSSLTGKTGPAPLFASPEKFPSLKDRFTDSLNYKGDVVKSCIHCHQIGDAIRDHYRATGEPIPESVLFPYPHPKSIGLILNPEVKSEVKSVEPSSLAEAAGFQANDDIVSLNNQPILSIADVQWVLHSVPPEGGMVSATVNRGGKPVNLTLSLPQHWRRMGDISWRVSSWGLRRMATGGMRLATVESTERSRLNLANGKMALKVTHVGQYGAHATAKKAGFRVDDVIIQVDQRDDLLTETDLMLYGCTEKKAGESVRVTILRNGQKKTLQLPMQG